MAVGGADMARNVTEVLRVRGWLRAASPVHIGGVGGGVDADMELAEDGHGRWYVPGTSLAGAFREWTERWTGEAAVAASLWGSRDAASRIVVEDGLVECPARAAPEIRDGVGIDRRSGTAAPGIRHTRAVLPRGSRIALEMAVEFLGGGAERRDAERRCLGQMLTDLRAGRIALGAAVTRGLGRVVLEEVCIRATRRNTRAGLLAELRGTDPPLRVEELLGGPEGDGEATARSPVARSVTLRVHWRPAGPVMVAAGRAGLAVDTLPLTTTAADGCSIAFVLPGSALKGALRAQAERIVRTVLGRDAPRAGQDDDPHRHFVNQVRVPLVDAVFGSPERRGVLAVEDCLSRTAMAAEHWAAVEAAGEAHGLRQALAACGLPGADAVTHAAIDRWTGGAADRLLFNVLEVPGLEWSPLTLHADLTRLPPDTPPKACVALLLLVLGDLRLGRFPLGGQGYRGMGGVSLDRVECATAGLDPLPGSFALGGGDASPWLPDDIAAALLPEWGEWTRHQRSAVGVSG